MNTVTLKYPKGLSFEISEDLNAISQNSHICEDKNFKITIFSGVGDDYMHTLRSKWYYNYIVVIR